MADNYLNKKELRELNELINEAKKMMNRAYAPYSNFKVGAALRAGSGKIYTGCNIENAAYSPSLCAERTAFAKAVSEGERQFRAICIAGGQDGVIKGPCYPCGVCRQVMAEFCDPDDFEIIMVNESDTVEIYSLRELLPKGFTL